MDFEQLKNIAVVFTCHYVNWCRGNVESEFDEWANKSGAALVFEAFKDVTCVRCGGNTQGFNSSDTGHVLCKECTSNHYKKDNEASIRKQIKDIAIQFRNDFNDDDRGIYSFDQWSSGRGKDLISGLMSSIKDEKFGDPKLHAGLDSLIEKTDELIKQLKSQPNVSKEGRSNE